MFFIVPLGHLHKISSKSVHNFLSNVVHKQTNRQTYKRYQKHNLLCQGGNNKMIVIACPDQGSGNDTEALGLAKKW